MALPQRLKSAISLTARRVWTKKYWALLFLAWELLKDRFANLANTIIDENARPVIKEALRLFELAVAQPVFWTLVVILAIILIVFLHAYISDTKSRANAFEEKPQNPAEFSNIEATAGTSRPEYAAWAKLDPLELWQAACLWEGIEPELPLPPGPTRIRLEILRRGIFEKRIDAEIGGIANAKMNMAKAMVTALGPHIPDDIISERTPVLRGSLRAYADAEGENPAFISGDFRPQNTPVDKLRQQATIESSSLDYDLLRKRDAYPIYQAARIISGIEPSDNKMTKETSFYEGLLIEATETGQIARADQPKRRYTRAIRYEGDTAEWEDEYPPVGMQTPIRRVSMCQFLKLKNIDTPLCED